MPTRGRLLARDTELDQLRAALIEATTGHGKLVLVVGDTGIGKTALTEEFAAIATSTGARLARGGAPSGDALLPFAAIVEAFRDALATYGKELVQSLPGHQVRELSRLLPELQGDPTGVDPVAPELAQVRLLEALVGFARQLATPESAGVLVIEDVHWADASTAEFLAYLGHAVRSLRLLVIATSRGEDVETTAWLRRLAVEGARRDPESVIELRPLPTEATRSLAAAGLAGGASAGMVDLVVARSGGNPYFALELARSVAAGGVPSTLRGLISERLHQLPDAAAHVLRLASAHGVRGPVDLLEVAAGLPTGDAARAIREAHSRRLLDVGDGAWSFRHPLVAEVIYQELLPGERRRLHAALAQVLSSTAGAGAALPPGLAIARARHWSEAGNAEQAFPALLGAAELAEGMHAFAEAHTLYERALAVAPEMASGRTRGPIGFHPPSGGGPHRPIRELTTRAAAAASYAGRPGRAVELLEQVLAHEPDAADKAEDPAADLLLRERLARYRLEAGDWNRSLEDYRLAAEEAEGADGATRARVLAAYARALQVLGRHHEGATVATAAVQHAVEARSVLDELQARATLGACLAAVGQVAEGVVELTAARRLQDLVGSASRVQSSRIIDVLASYLGAASALDRAGQPDASASVAAEGRAAAQRLGVRGVWGGLLGSVAAMELVDLGRWIEAEDLAAQLIDGGEPEASAGRVARAQVRVGRGQLEEAAEELQRVRAESLHGPALAGFFGTAADLALARGDLEGARRTIDSGLGEVGLSDRLAVAQLVCIGLRADAERVTVARLRRASGDLTELRRDAEVLRGLVADAEHGDKAATTKHQAFVLLAEAEFGRASGEPDPDRWEAAVRAFDHLRGPYLAAYSRLRSAEARLSAAGGRADAQRLLRAAAAGAHELGAAPLAREIEAVAKRARIELATEAETPETEPTEPSAAKQLGLSPREMEVLELLAEGLTNREIAERLFITEKTAGHHVSSILGKLGVRGRVEAAAAAARMGAGERGSGPGVGGREPGGPDTAVRTFMFTDLVNSTALVQAIGDSAWAQLSAWHDATLRALFERYGGEEIDHAGDGFFVAFRSAAAAIDCAIAVQRTLAAHRRSHGFAPRVRIGLHQGEAVREGPTLRGRAVHEAARIAALADGDEIVASDAVLAGARRTYPGAERRTTELRGVAGTIELISVPWS